MDMLLNEVNVDNEDDVRELARAIWNSYNRCIADSSSVYTAVYFDDVDEIYKDCFVRAVKSTVFEPYKRVKEDKDREIRNLVERKTELEDQIDRMERDSKSETIAKEFACYSCGKYAVCDAGDMCKSCFDRNCKE